VSTLELDQLECIQGGRSLFTGLSRRVEAGTLLRVEGANGAGKTSLLRTLCGLRPPAHGEVRWQGRPLRALKESFHGQLVYLGHAPAVKDDLTAVENLRSALALGGRRVSADQAAAALKLTGLSRGLAVPVRALSQGQRKRVALARLPLSAHAPLWVLDEPFNALDGAAAGWLAQTLAGHVRQGGIVVLTSHQAIPWGAPVPEMKVSL
jgi:heme exporter protein A